MTPEQAISYLDKCAYQFLMSLPEPAAVPTKAAIIQALEVIKAAVAQPKKDS